MITDSLGNQGFDRNEDGILSSDEIDVRATAVGVGADEISGSFSGMDTDWSTQDNAMNTLLGSDSFNNGRMGDIKMIDNVKVTSEQDIVIRSDNKETAVKGLVEESALSNYFFSEMNTKVIQDTLRYKVYQNTNMIVDYQSSQELYIIMRSILLQHGNFKVSTSDIVTEIQTLNALVVNYATGEVSSNVTQYQGYLSDLETLPAPFDRPAYSGGSDNNTYDISNFIGMS